MQVPLRITFRNMPPSEAIEARVRQKAQKLERFHSRITGCQVTIEAPHRHHHKGQLYQVTVDMTLPGGEIVASRSPSNDHSHEDVYVAIRDSFDAALRQLEDQTRRQRGEVKSHDAPTIGRVIRLFRDDGYGFIETPDGLEVYFHENSLVGSSVWDLNVGSEVRFTLAETESEKGPQATTVIAA
jgi:ribosomal subunit interface protein